MLGTAMRPETARKLREWLIGVTSEAGTGKRAALPWTQVAGKTGTVSVVKATGYQDSLNNAYFLGFAPAQEPRYLVAVFVFEAQPPANGGGSLAAPLSAEIMAHAFRLRSLDLGGQKLQ